MTEHLFLEEGSIITCCGIPVTGSVYGYYHYVFNVNCEKCKEHPHYKELNTIFEIGFDCNKENFKKNYREIVSRIIKKDRTL